MESTVYIIFIYINYDKGYEVGYTISRI